MLTRKEFKENAKKQLRGKRTTGVIITLVMIALIWCVELIMMGCWGIGNAFSKTAGVTAMAIICILWVILAFVLSTGYCWAFLKIRRGEQTGIGELFHPFRRFGKVIGVNVLIFVVLLVIYLIGAAIAAVLAIFVHPVLAVIVGIAAVLLLYRISLGFAMVPYLLFDRSELGVRACINYSVALMRGHKWEFFVLCLSFIWWYLLTAITCGILSLWIGPYVSATIANYYDELVRLNSGEGNGQTIAEESEE